MIKRIKNIISGGIEMISYDGLKDGFNELKTRIDSLRRYL